MTTVNDKLKSFSKDIIHKVEKDCEARLLEFTTKNNELLKSEKEKALKEAFKIVDDMKAKIENDRRHIISKSVIDREHSFIKKKNEFFGIVIDDIIEIAQKYSSSPDYSAFLKKCIDAGLSKLKQDEAIILLKPDDLSNYGEMLTSYINEKYNEIKISLGSTNAPVLGGCICTNLNKTIRIDCSLSALIDDNRDMIGKILMENL